MFLLFGVCTASYGGHGSYDDGHHNIDVAIHSKHSVQVIPVTGTKMAGKTPIIDINSDALPLTLRFNSHSSRINAIQKHIGHSGQVYKQNAIDEPDLLIQNVQKPVIQEVREIISPFRNIFQEIRPVQEQIQTIIARGQDGGAGGGVGTGTGYGSGYNRHGTYKIKSIY